MRLTVLLPGLLLIAVGRPVLSASAQISVPMHNRSRSACRARQDTQPAPDPILIALAQRLRAAFRQDHLPMRVYFHADVLVAEYHTQPVRLYLRDMRGHESPNPTAMIVPAADGVRLELQVEPGNYVDQAVRPQTLRRNYRTAGNRLAGWTTYLDQYALKKADRSLLLNLEVGGKVNPQWITRIKAAVRRGATATT